MAQSVRKFHKHVIQVTVLCEGVPFEWDNLGNVAYEISQGDCVVSVKEIKHEVLSALQAARLLYKMGSEPGFFQLTDGGGDMDGGDMED